MNLPNKLSLMRIALVPLLAIVYLYIDLPECFVFTVDNSYLILTFTDIIVLLIFAIASITDFLDGSIARKYNLITSFGKFIDPIADKLLVNTLFILFAWSGEVSVVAVLLMIARDTIVDGLRMSASSKGKVVAAGILGKLKTVLQMFAIIVILLNNIPFAFFHIAMDQILLWAAVIVSLLSGVVYFIKLKDVILETM